VKIRTILRLNSLDLFADIGFLPVAGLLVEPLHASETFVVAVDILSVEVVN
jgi:hypothetical protein